MDSVDVAQVVSGIGYHPDDMWWIGSGPGADRDVLAVRLHQETGWFEQWDRFRSLVEVTGRWPVGTDQPAADGEGGRDYLRDEFALPESCAADFVAAAVVADADEVFRSYQLRLDERDPMEQFDRIFVGEDVADRWRSEAIESVDCTSGRDVERFLVRKQIEEGTHQPLSSPGEWRSLVETPGWVILIPDSDPVNGLAYAAAFDSVPSTSLPVARRWAREHGVELVAAVGCSNLFQMPKSIADPDQAWRMGAELIELWDCSVGGAPAGLGAVHIGPELATNIRFDGTLMP